MNKTILIALLAGMAIVGCEDRKYADGTSKDTNRVSFRIPDSADVRYYSTGTYTDPVDLAGWLNEFNAGLLGTDWYIDDVRFISAGNQTMIWYSALITVRKKKGGKP